MGFRFNPPPNWPIPPGWTPTSEQQINPQWPPAPPGWQFWIPDEPVVVPPMPAPPEPPTPRSRRGLVNAIISVVSLVLTGVGIWQFTGGGHTDIPRPDAAPAPSAAVVVVPVPTVLILDGSGSMTIPDAPGPRIDAAKKAAHGLLDALPEAATIALETYGTATGSADGDKPAGCRDVTSLVPMGPINRSTVGSAVDRITPSGYTPISLALQTAAGQLSNDDKTQAIVLMSDGEDTCDTPPCDTAAQLKKTHPALAISTVGFKVDGPAADQLRCIANATGGLFVQADNAAQLAARLLATQNLDQANSSMNSTGIGDINLGDQATAIKAKHADFPDVATGSVTVTWRDCDYGFLDAVLDSIRPHNGGRTIDGITVGSPVTKAAELYGKPLATKTRGSDIDVIFGSDDKTDAAYNMTVEGFTEADNAVTGTVKSIVLCRCKPRAGAGSGPEPETVVLTPVDSHGSVLPGFAKDNTKIYTNTIDCTDNYPSPYDATQGVRSCGGVLGLADACWPTANGTYVLCLSSPWDKTLTMWPAKGAASTLPPHKPSTLPMGIELEDGSHCRINGNEQRSDRDADHHQTNYVCENGAADRQFMWTSPSSDANGITRGPDGWTGQVSDMHSGPLTTRKVTKIYYVGMA